MNVISERCWFHVWQFSEIAGMKITGANFFSMLDTFLLIFFLMKKQLLWPWAIFL